MPASKTRHVCAFCAQCFRADRIISHILAKHSADLKECMNPKDVAYAIEQRTPMMWQINWKVTVASLLDKWGDAGRLASAPKETEFAACLVCKTGMYLFGKGDYRNWFKQHSKGPCEKHWNDVCGLYGAEPHVEGTGPSEATQNTLDELRKPRVEDIPDLLKKLAEKEKLVAHLVKLNKDNEEKYEKQIEVLNSNYAQLHDKYREALRPRQQEKPVQSNIQLVVSKDSDDDSFIRVSGLHRCQKCGEQYKDCDDCDGRPANCDECFNKIGDCECE
jgi:hypothetical protein